MGDESSNNDFRPDRQGLTETILRAGTSKCDITTGREGAPVLDRLHAKVLVLDDGRKKIVILSMDAVAIGGICDIRDDFLPALRQRIEGKLGIPGHHVLVNASHTHPPGRILCEDEELLERTFGAVKRASDSLSEVRIGVGSGHETRLTLNRNLRLKNGRHWTIRHANPCPPDEEVAGLNRVDTEIGLLRIDRMDGSPLAVVYNFACHLLFGDPKGSITANIPGVASNLIEQTLGAGCMALFLQGAAGDVIDAGFKDFHRVRDIEPLGIMLGLDVLKAREDIPVGNADLDLVSDQVEFPRRTDIPRRIRQLEKERENLLVSLRFTSLNFKNFLLLYLKYSLHPEFPADDAHMYFRARKTQNTGPDAMDPFNRENIRKYLGNIRSMERLAAIQDEIATFERHEAINRESGSRTISAELQAIRIGECVLISAPVEVLTEVGLNIKKASPFRHTFIAAFSNGYMHYGPPASDYDKGGYEVIECFLAPEWQEIFEAKVSGLLDEVRSRASRKQPVLQSDSPK